MKHLFKIFVLCILFFPVLGFADEAVGPIDQSATKTENSYSIPINSWGGIDYTELSTPSSSSSDTNNNALTSDTPLTIPSTPNWGDAQVSRNAGIPANAPIKQKGSDENTVHITNTEKSIPNLTSTSYTPFSNTNPNVNVGSPTVPSLSTSGGSGTTTTTASNIASNSAFQKAYDQLFLTFTNARVVVYMLSGFGLIGFALAAIFGKLSLRWLAMIAISLFILAMTESIISYIMETGSGKVKTNVTFTDDEFGTFKNDPNEFQYQNYYHKGNINYRATVK